MGGEVQTDDILLIKYRVKVPRVSQHRLKRNILVHTRLIGILEILFFRILLSLLDLSEVFIY